MKYSIESYIDHLFSIAWQISTNSNRLAFFKSRMHLHGTNSVVQFHFQNYMLNCLFSDLILDIVSANVRASIYFRTSNAMAKGFLLGKVYLRRRRVRYKRTVNS